MSLSFVHGDKSAPQTHETLKAVACWYLGIRIEFGPSITLGVYDGNSNLGVVVFHDFIAERGTIEMTIAAVHPRWLSRAVIREIARLGFVVNGCQMMFARCDASNKAANRILSKIGFHKAILPNMRGAGRDEVFFCITRDQWEKSRFIS